MNLYELTNDYLKLLEMAQEEGIDEQTFNDTMEGIVGAIEDKADGYAKVIKNLDGTLSMIDAEISRLKSRKNAIESNKTRLISNLTKSMIAVDKTKFKTELFSFGLQNNQPSLKIDDESKIPDSFKIPQPPKIDNAGIKELLKKGEKLDYAHLETTQSLRIR